MTNIPLYRWNSKFFGTSGSWTPVEESDVRISKKFKVLDPKLSGSEALSLKIATWNVWFDATLQKLRTNELLKVLIAENPDVVCLQEITVSFQRVLAENDFARSNWLCTSLLDESKETRSTYGTMIFIRKALVMERGWRAKVSFTPFEASKCGRGLTLLEITPPDSSQPILIGNVHFELETSLRAQQFTYCQQALTSPSSNARLSILCGDTNIFAYSELETGFLQHGFIDTLFQANPLPPNMESLLPPEERLFHMPTFGKAGIKFVGKPSRERIARLDYILARPGTRAESSGSADSQNIAQLGVKSGKILGDVPISTEIIKKNGVDDPEMKVWPSDHCGLAVEITGF